MIGARNLTEGSIIKQLFALAIPIMGTSFIQMAYNLTDMAWVGRLGSESIAAVGSVGLLTWMSQSVALLNKVGAEVSVANAIGIKDSIMARIYASHNITISLIISILLTASLFILANNVINLFALKENITIMAVQYLKIISTAIPFVFLSATFTGIFNAAGRSSIPFKINGIGLILNMLLDPLLIFGFDMNTKGAAIATWIAQFTVFILFIYKIKIKKVLFDGIPLIIHLKKNIACKIIKIGFPVATLNTMFAFISMFLGKTATSQGGHIGLMALTTGGQIEAITWTTSQGFSTALSSFVAQNYAALKIKRVIKSFHITLSMALFFGLICSFLFICYGNEIFSIFVPEIEAYTAGGEYLRIDGYSQIFMMLEITVQGMFYGIGMTIPPAIISIGFNFSRIPLAMWLIHLGLGLESIWWSICITSILKGITCLIWFIIIKKKKLNIL